MASGADGGRDDLARWVDGLVEGRRGRLVQQKGQRRVWQVEDSGREGFAKLGTGGKRSEVRREAGHAEWLADVGLGPAVLASGPFGDGEWLVTASAGVWPVGRFSGLVVGSGQEPAPCFDVLVRELRRFHELGFSSPDLTGNHVFWIPAAEGAAPDGIHVIDAARLRRHSGPTPMGNRVRDLAALTFSMLDMWSDRRGRLRFLRACLPVQGAALREALRSVDAEWHRLGARTRWRHRWYFVTDSMRPALDQATGDDFPFGGYWAYLFDPSYTNVVRTLPDRENRTLGRRLDGRPMFFIKVFPPTKSGWSPAMLELAAIDRFQRAGILVNRVAAYAEDVDKGSMVAVKACDGEPLDDFLRRTDAAAPTVAERRALAVQTAQIWRRMRERGLRHRDAYPCHLFVARTDTPLRFELRLIDMTRAGEAPWPKERWFVKDAAALWHGCPKPPVTRTDAVRWLREYFRVPKLTREAKRFARKVAAKERSIATRQARKARKAREATARGAAGGAGRP